MKVLFLCSIFLLLAIFMWSCQEEKAPGYKERGALLYGTINWHIKQYAAAENLYPAGTGGSIPKQVECFSIMYDSQAKMTIPEARRLLLRLNNGLINKVNENPENAPLLGTFPIGPKQSGISVSFESPSREEYPLPYVSFAHVTNGYIYYKKIYTNPYKFELMHRESYEEAQRIVDEENGL